MSRSEKSGVPADTTYYRAPTSDPAAWSGGGTGHKPGPAAPVRVTAADTSNMFNEDGGRTFEGFRKLFMQHWHVTITYCAMFWSFGMCVAFLGPTLLDLGCMTSSDMKTMSWVFFAQLLCSLIGASVAGYLVQSFDANNILLVNTILLPLCMFIIPFCKALVALAFVLAIMGFNMGFIDCLANLQMINVYGEAVAPFLHALHFCYGMGAFVSPMIVEPFLLNEDCSPFIDGDIVQADGSTSILALTSGGAPFLNDTSLPAETLKEAQDMTKVRYAFWIMAAVQAPIPGLVFSLIMRLNGHGWGKQGKQIVEEEDAVEEKAESTPSVTSSTSPPQYQQQQTLQQPNQQWKPQNSDYGTLVPQPITASIPEKSTIPSDRVPIFKSERSQMLAIVGCTAALLFIYDGLQSSFGGYVYSYAFKSIVDLNKTEGAYLNALFWGTFAVGRLLSIVLATKFTPAFMLLGNIMGCVMSMTLMLLIHHSHVVLYIGTFIFGMFLSSVAPTSISLAEMYIDINSSITSVLVVIAALGEMICPVIVGNLFVSAGPRSFLVFNDTMCFLSVGVFSFLWLVGRTTPKYLVRVDGSFIWCRMCCIRKDAGQPAHTVQHVKYLRKHESENSNIEMSLVAGSNQSVVTQQ